MTDQGTNPTDAWPRAWRWVALAWLLVVAAIGWHQARFWQQSRIDSDVLALLPRDADDRALDEVTRRIADSGARQMLVLVGASTAEEAKAAEAAFTHALAVRRKVDPASVPFAKIGAAQDWFAQAQAFYASHRDRLLTVEQRELLAKSSPDELAQQALASLYSPVGAPRLTAWQADPLGLWPQWWQARAAASGMQIGEDGVLQAENRYWSALQYETTASAFRVNGDRVIQDALDAATRAAKTRVPDVRLIAAGVPLHAEAAATQANREMNTIGWGSLAAVLLLVWLSFRSLRPILLVAASLLIGVAAALSVTALAFGKVHLLTLIFGASLVGVAEDYGIHWFASRQGGDNEDRWRLLRQLLPGLAIALVTSALAYLALGLAPFPGLRQMALFSVVGLTAAFLTVICWFPWLDGGVVRATPFASRIGDSLARFPRIAPTKAWGIAGIALACVIVAGMWTLETDDDLRSLQSSPHALIEQQVEAGRILGLPSPAQFFLVRGTDAQQVLQREEALVARLRDARAKGEIANWRAISDWLPSRRQQDGNARISANLETEVLARIGAATGEPLQRAAFAPRPLELSEFLASPASQPVRQLWLGSLDGDVASVVMIGGLSKQAARRLGARADGIEGVRWIDRTADFSRLLHHYRVLMSWLLLAGTLLVFGALYARYRNDAWRILLPSVIAGLLAVALLGWCGQPLQLFNVLALLLLLGVGIDYGIFLAEHDGDPRAWMAVCVGAASTWLSFGLLGLSATPALRAFGLTLLIGIIAVWLLSPLFRPLASTHRHQKHDSGTSP